MKKKSILIKIFAVIITFASSLILFIWAAWGVILNKPNQFYAHIHFMITLIILVIVGSLVASILIRIIMKPLSVLNEAVKKVEKGDLDQYIKIESKDEFGALADAFNSMTASLKKMILSRDQLLSDVSHELRTPITRAWLALEMMKDSPEKESLAGDLKEMEAMITGILESERLKSGNAHARFAPVKVAALLEKLAENYRSLPGRLLFLPVSDEAIIQADETLITTVLRNVIDNALKYSPIERPIEISVIHTVNQSRIEIEDFGKGIPEEDLPYVFEPFYRADHSRSRKTGGYGLGLHLCKRIMDLHNGEIRLQNKARDSGLKVILTFNTPASAN